MKRWICITAAFLLMAGLLPAVPSTAQTVVNLVPETAGTAPNTFSSWWIQSAEQYDQMGKTGKTLTIRDVVTDDFLFNRSYGWCYTQYPSVRKDMIFVVCDGWELPDSKGDTVNPDAWFGTQIFDEGKFPGYGDTPQERLKTYADKVRAAGWKGAGLWICAQEDTAHRPVSGYDAEFWTQRILWSKYAGITYWEIDWGTLYNILEWRRFISSTANELYPELVIEHITGAGGLNDENNTGRVTASANHAAVQVAGFSDVFRTYDVTTQLTNATTLDRVAQLLRDGYTLKGDGLGLLCAEDQVYLNAALGMVSMVFRSSRSHTNTDEAARALRWGRIAPAYEIGAYETTLSETVLEDNWNFRDGDTWYSNVTGKTVRQYAPAVISRGIGEAQVSVESGLVPFVAAARNPNGAISVVTLGRTQGREHYYDVRADVTLPVGELTGLIGVFGRYNSLTLTFSEDMSGKQILAQDLLADRAEDITDRVCVDGNKVILPGALIDETGLSARSWDGDTSQPGMVLQISSPDGYAQAPAIRERTVEPDPDAPVFENFSFEESAVGAAPAGWNFWRGGGTTESTVVTAEGGHEGEKSCLISGAENHEGSVGQTFTGIPNGIYSASVWVKGTKNNGGINFSAVYGPGDYIAQYVTAVLGNGLSEWTKITLNDIQVKNGQIEIQIYFNAKAGEMLWLDDFSLQLVQPMAKQYTVTLFDSSNGTVIGQETVAAGEMLPKPSAPVKSGYTFLDWTVNGVPYDFTRPVTANFVLTATWKKDNPDEPEKVNRPLWTMENLPDDLSSFITTGWGNKQLGDEIDAVKAEGKGTNGTTALGYTYHHFDVNDNGGNVLQIALGQSCGADKYWADGEMLWFWVDASEMVTPLLLDVNLNWNSLGYGCHAYSWDGTGETKDMGAMPPAWSGYTGASRVQLVSGYRGWVGVPLAAYPSLNTADVNTLILYFEIAQDRNNLPKTVYFDNFWLTEFGKTPRCSHTAVENIEGVAPTCTTPGTESCLRCRICGRYLDESRSVIDGQPTVPALKHDFVNGICTRCGAEDPARDPCEGYTDVNRSLWYHEAVDFVIESGYMGSTKTDALTFEPNTKVSRAMVASIMYRIAGTPVVEYKGSFTDVKAGKWFTNAIEWAAQNGLAAGRGDGKFDPNGNVTRQELAVFMYKLAEFLGRDITAAADLSEFKDAATVASWAKSYMEWAVAKGLISGKGQKDGSTLLAPKDTAARAEFASIISRFIIR